MEIPKIVDLGVRKFKSGQVVATPAALQFLEEAGVSPLDLLMRHLRGDWGDLDRHDLQANEQALKDGGRLFSSYRVGTGKTWIISEADRSSTCVLLPEDY